RARSRGREQPARGADHVSLTQIDRAALVCHDAEAMLHFSRGTERCTVEYEIEYGMPGVSSALDRVIVTTVRDGRPEPSRCTSLPAAMRAYHSVVASHLDEGFALFIGGVTVDEPSPTTFASFPELEKLLDEDLASSETWSVLADAYCQAGDPRGDCIHLERSMVGLTDTSEYLRRKAGVEAVRRARVAHVWGVLRRDAYRVRASFREGLVDKLVLEDELAAPGQPTPALLAALLANPFARFVREISVSHADRREVEAAVRASPRAGRIKL